MKNVQYCILMTLFSLFFINQAITLPRYAIKAGTKCISCHINPTGGQMRNDYGIITYSKEILPIKSSGGEAFTFDPKISENISIGADFRSQFILDLDTTGGAKNRTAFHAMSAKIYGNVQLTQKISFFYKQDITNNNYEAFGIAEILPYGFYIKGGSFLPDYGWNIDDHTAFTRGGNKHIKNKFYEGLIFTQNYSDVGIEIGGSINGFVMSAGLFNGRAGEMKLTKDKAYVGHIHYIGKISEFNYILGVSGYGFKDYRIVGVNFGFNAGNIVVHGEVDRTKRVLKEDFSIGRDSSQLAGFVELDYLFIDGLWFMGRFDVFNRRIGKKDDDLRRLTAGLVFFPYPFVELRPQYRFNIEKPEIKNNQAIVQLHVWF